MKTIQEAADDLLHNLITRVKRIEENQATYPDSAPGRAQLELGKRMGFLEAKVERLNQRLDLLGADELSSPGEILSMNKHLRKLQGEIHGIKELLENVGEWLCPGGCNEDDY